MSRRTRVIPLILCAVLAVPSGSGAVTASSGADAAYATHAQAKERCRKGRVALTFDDGPQRGVTGKLLKVLRRKHVVATFFVQGYLARAYPGLMRRMAGNQHRIGNHTWNHPRLTKLRKGEIRRQLAWTNHAIKRWGGVRATLVRPPYGATNAKVAKVVHKLGMHEVLWTDDSENWTGISSAAIVRRALRGIRPGDNIILLHDGVANSDRTVKAVPRIIRGIRKRGYCVAPLNRRGDPRKPYDLLWPTHW